MAANELSALLESYHELKSKHPDAVLLFRVGDFYEILGDDAPTASEILGLELSSRELSDGGTINSVSFSESELDSYLPKLTRAGKRVAICEQRKPVEPTKPAEPAKPSSKPAQPKPTKRAKLKEVNIIKTNGEISQMDDSGQLVAAFHFDVPKSMKNAGKQASKNAARTMLTQICIEPASGKAIVSDTTILSTFDIDCKGFWPGEQTTPFQCFIHPKAISTMAGKRCDISVYADGSNKLTISETDGCLCHSDLKERFPNWQRVIPTEGNVVKLKEGEADKLREYLKGKCGKYKPDEYKPKRVIIELDRANEVVVVTVQAVNPETDYYENVSEPGKFACINNGQSEVKVAVNAALLEIAVAADWTGEMVLIESCRPVKFIGIERISLVMPI